jgi:type IV secretion system protein VirB10
LPGDFDPDKIPDEPLPEDFDTEKPEPEDIEEPAPEDYELDGDGIEDAFGGEVPGEDDEPPDFFEPSENDSPAREEPGDSDLQNQVDDDDTPPEPDPVLQSTISGPQTAAEPFAPRKSPASQVLGSGKPHKLNSQLILSIAVGSFALIFVFATFVVPMLNRKKAEAAAKPRTTANTPTDYSALVPRQRQYADTEEENLDEIIEELPPVPAIDPQFVYQEPAATVSTDSPASSGSGGYQRPNTRDDRLQAKSIAGIKGVTPSQRNYMSGPGAVPYLDYQQTQDPNNPYAQFGLPSKEDYTQQMLSMYQGANADSYNRQNDQSGKMQFYNQGRENAGNGYWLGPNTVWQGTIFEATLTSNINTDLPGEATAWVTKNIYSSLDGRYLLIPQNSRLFGTYNSSISYSQSRVQVGWHTLIRPDGYMINLGGMQATDPRGAAGLKGFINDHPFQYLKALALISAFNILNVELGANIEATDNPYVQNVMANSQEIANTLGSKLIDRAMDVQPTITISAGTKINIVVNTTLTLPPLPPYEVNMPYHRGE